MKHVQDLKLGKDTARLSKEMDSCHGILKKRRLSPLSILASAYSKHFADEFQKEAGIRRNGVNPCLKQTPPGKHFWWQKPRQEGPSVYKAWVHMNGILHLAPFSWPPQNLYFAPQNLGVSTFIITPSMRVCTQSADNAEFSCMNL